MDRALFVRAAGLTRFESQIRRIHWPRKLTLGVNELRRVTGMGNYWRWIEVPELADGIEIAEIICPLRYDVLVRRDFYAFYLQHRDLYYSDRAAFEKLTRETSYYTWYLESEAVRTNKHLRGNHAALERNFSSRIGRAVALYESVKRDGFSRQYPIILKTAKHILPPTRERGGQPTGKTISAKYFLADGCHRLALLMALGCTVLDRDYFRVKCFQEFSPFDSTSLLARRLMSGPAEYLQYLSSRYTAPDLFTDQTSFLEYVRKYKPALLEEVISVMRADGFYREREGDA